MQHFKYSFRNSKKKKNIMNIGKLDNTELLLSFFWEPSSTELQCLFDSL